MTEKLDPSQMLRAPFAENQISNLPKGTKAQNDCPPSEKRNCALCGGWHHPKIIHLPYVGHAAVTDRLLSVDPAWVWEPVAFTPEGLPRFDSSGGLWIRLTVAGVSRLGYGHAANKSFGDPGSREKEVIGDAIRNAAMRFGVALELWHKGDLHGKADGAEGTEQSPDAAPITEAGKAEDAKTVEARAMLEAYQKASALEEVDRLSRWFKDNWESVRHVPNLADSVAAMRKMAKDRINGAGK